jgi:hypothetical protein
MMAPIWWTLTSGTRVGTRVTPMPHSPQWVISDFHGLVKKIINAAIFP